MVRRRDGGGISGCCGLEVGEECRIGGCIFVDGVDGHSGISGTAFGKVENVSADAVHLLNAVGAYRACTASRTSDQMVVIETEVIGKFKSEPIFVEVADFVAVNVKIIGMVGCGTIELYYPVTAFNVVSDDVEMFLVEDGGIGRS